MNDSANQFRKILRLTWQQTRRVVIALVGVSVLVVGAIMIIAPGPAFVVLPAGLAILAIEFVWARRLLRKIKIHGRRLARRNLRGAGADRRQGPVSWRERQLVALRYRLRRQPESVG